MELPNDYYLSNFHALTSFVSECYSELLTDTEKQWYRAINRLPENSQRLYIRLLGRRGETFRVSKIKYSEIPDISVALKLAQKQSLISSETPSDLHELLTLFTKGELIKLLKLNNRSLTRPEVINEALSTEHNTLRQALEQADSFAKIHGQAEFQVYRLCFFGNLYQDLSEFVLTDLGRQSFETYTIDKSSRAFHSREQLEAQRAVYHCLEQWDSTDVTDQDALLALDKQLPEVAIGLNDPHLVRRVDRLRNRIARQLERLDAPMVAFSLYSRSSRPPSRERRVRLLTQLEKYEDALSLCQQMQDYPIAEEELVFAELFVPKLNKAMGRDGKKPKGFRPATTKLTLKPSENRVELAAQDFYSQFGQCHYVENSLINAVLGLFIWDIVFLPVANAFYNPFQSRPADFYEPSFLQLRAKELASRWELLADQATFSATVWEHYETKQGIANPLVNWSWINEELLTLALVKVPVNHYRLLFDRMLRDLRNNTSGFPDLILFSRGGGYEFIEIKGPGDAVQKNQKRWMQYFSEHRIPYRVVNVRWSVSAV